MDISQLSTINLATDSTFVLIILSLVTLTTYAAASLLFLGLAGPALRGSNTTLSLQIAISLACGPMTLAWLLAIMLRVAPGNPSSFYTSFILITLLIGSVFGLTYLYKQISVLLTGTSDRERRNQIYLFGISLLVICCFLIIFLRPILELNLVLPVVGNDTLDYFTAAGLIFEQASLVNYPFVDSDKSGGFYGYWTHPPGFSVLLAWSNFLQDHSLFAGGGRITALWHYGALISLTFAVAARAGYKAAFGAVLFMLATPFFAKNAIYMHIDTTRIAIFTAAIVTVIILLNNYSFKRLLLAGFTIGLAQFVHSIGILAVLLSMPAYFLLRQLPWNSQGILRRLFEVCALTTVAMIVVLPDHLVNLQVYGTLVKDKPAIWAIPHLDVRAHREYVRMIATPLDTIFNGILKGFTNIREFSYTYWIFAFIALLCSTLCYRGIFKWFYNIKNKKTVAFSDVSALGLFVLGFYAIVLLSVIAGSDLIIKNTRYLATPHGLIAILFGLFIAILTSGSVEKNIFMAVRTVVSSGFSIYRRLIAWLEQFWPILFENSIKRLMTIILFVTFGAVGLQTMMQKQELKKYHYKLYGINSKTSRLDSVTKTTLAPRRVYKLIYYINQRAGKGDWPLEMKVLTFRKADSAFYLDVPYIAYLDSKLAPFYKTRTKKAGMSALRNLKIGWVIAPSYPLPTLYNSVLQDIIGDPLLATLLKDEGGYKLYKININMKPTETVISDILLRKPTPTDKEWFFWDSEKRNPADFSVVDEQTGAVTIFNSRGVRRDNTKRTRAWTATCATNAKTDGPIPGTMAATPGTYQLSTDVKGHGYLKIWIWEMKRDKISPECNLAGRHYVVWEGLQSDKERKIQQQFTIPPSSSHDEYVWVTMFEVVDGGRLSVGDIQIRRVFSSGHIDVEERF